LRLHAFLGYRKDGLRPVPAACKFMVLLGVPEHRDATASQVGPYMQLRMFWSKIHRAVITHADLHYEGSCTIDADLLDAADILANQELHIWNITRGTRLVTYALPGPRGSGVICINGAAAHGNVPGDMVILATFSEMSREEALHHQPKVVRVDRENKVLGIREETPGPQMPPHIDDFN
jgi:aspartate 1-decarboxylase